MIISLATPPGRSKVSVTYRCDLSGLIYSTLYMLPLIPIYTVPECFNVHILVWYPLEQYLLGFIM